MASRDLVGRPLVPFFDADENVNDSLQLADDEREEMDVDARVWDKELGYFVYPAEQSNPSTPMDIAKPRDSRTDSGGKLLLTPSMMLSSSAPDNFNSMAADGNPVRAADAPTRSSSMKRGAKKKKNRSETPVRRRNGNEGGEDGVKTKKGKSKGGNANNSGAQKDQLSSSGKFAWSAFQSAPEPCQLPMPPFLTKPGGNLSNGIAPPAAPAPPLPPTPPPPMQHSAPVPPPLPPGQPPLPPGLPSGQPPLPPGQPPLPPEETAPLPMSIELSMTQDLRRMLNIGGG